MKKLAIAAAVAAALAAQAASAGPRSIKACVMQPPYAYDTAKIGESVQWELDALARCDESLDLIVLPEASDRQGAIHSPEELADAVEKYNARLLAACSETARRCKATVFVNAIGRTPTGLRNSTFAYDKTGALVGRYDKEHLVRSEHAKLHLDASYMWEWTRPTTMEIDGIRYAFLTCYDFYFYENFSNIARCKPDIIIGCSHQRSDPHDVLETIGRFLAYNTASYLVRASVSMGLESPVGGGSMIVSPRGQVLGNMFSKVGTLTVEFDPHEKYLKPMGYGNPKGTHPTYIEIGRRPWKYRPAGSAIVPGFSDSPGQRLCAVDGLASATSAGRLAALGAAVAVGVSEMAFVIGPGDSDAFSAILKKLSCHVIMYVRLKGASVEWGDAELARALDIVNAYDALGHICVATGDEALLDRIAAIEPSITRALRYAGDDAPGAAKRAAAHGCRAIELVQPNAAATEAAHKAALRVYAPASFADVKSIFGTGVDSALVPDYK